jgi:hypothetical protein
VGEVVVVVDALVDVPTEEVVLVVDEGRNVYPIAPGRDVLIHEHAEAK